MAVIFIFASFRQYICRTLYICILCTDKKLILVKNAASAICKGRVTFYSFVLQKKTFRITYMTEFAYLCSVISENDCNSSFPFFL